MRGFIAGCAIAAGVTLAGQAFAGNLTGVGDASTADQSSVVGLSNQEGYNTFGRNRYTMPYSDGAYGAYGVPYYGGRSMYRSGPGFYVEE